MQEVLSQVPMLGNTPNIPKMFRSSPAKAFMWHCRGQQHYLYLRGMGSRPEVIFSGWNRSHVYVNILIIVWRKEGYGGLYPLLPTCHTPSKAKFQDTPLFGRQTKKFLCSKLLVKKNDIFELELFCQKMIKKG